ALRTGAGSSRRLLPSSCNKLPRFADVNAERFVSDLSEPNSYPATRPQVRWFEVRLRRVFDQRGLKTRGHRKPDRELAVVVVIVHEHGEDALALLDEKSRSAMRRFLESTRHGCAEAADSLQLRFAASLFAAHF